MKVLYSIYTLSLLSATLIPVKCNAQECIYISMPNGKTEIRVPSGLTLGRANGQDTMTPSSYWLYHNGENLALSGPGKFCLAQDIVRHVDTLADLTGEAGHSEPLIDLANSGIELDFNGLALRSNRASLAIKGYVGGHINDTQIKNMTFRNGIIDMKGKGIEFTGWQYTNSPPNYRPGPAELATATNWYGPNFKKFNDTNIILEKLNIKSNGLAVYLIGRNNIIRHCHIEVEGHEAIALFGSNTQLIDNEIIIKRSLRAPPSPDQPNPALNLGSYYTEYAAIWIRDAPGTIIQGNKITIEGLIPAKEAILLINSPNVIIKNNEIMGTQKIYTAIDTQSSANVSNNRKRFGKWTDK